MNLLEVITNDMKEAMKEKDSFKLGVIRMAKGSIDLEKINKKQELTESEIIDVISKQIKMRKESIIEFEKACRNDLVEKNTKEIEILNKYMPEQLSDKEIETIINQTFSNINPTSIKDMGKVMGELTPLLKGKADMSKVGADIRKKLENL